MWNRNIRFCGRKCATLLYVQEITWLLLRHIITRHSANEPHDNIALPNCEIPVGQNRSSDWSSSLLSDKFNNQWIFNKHKMCRYKTLLEYRGGNQILLPRCHNAPGEKLRAPPRTSLSCRLYVRTLWAGNTWAASSKNGLYLPYVRFPRYFCAAETLLKLRLSEVNQIKRGDQTKEAEQSHLVQTY